ncbi:MAG TPA: alpha-ribazole phosphatase [Dissulfurispiraceae bacterium]|nr:alpha-ribazole phosphatase [Dissulfurispiraceae bacterium]
MDSRTLYLIRHGQIQLPDNRRRFIGQIDLPMSIDGVQQIQCLHDRLSCKEIKHIFCSDLSRSKQTAQILAAGTNASIETRTGLREINLGEWEGLSFDEIMGRHPDEFKARGKDIAHYSPPGGESFFECSRRLLPVFENIISTSSGDIIIVGHAGINRIIICHILGMPLNNLFRIGQDYACINIIKCLNSDFLVESLNLTYGAHC